jgi:hypothetical protein
VTELEEELEVARESDLETKDTIGVADRRNRTGGEP